MSRGGCDNWDDENYPNEAAFWENRADMALRGKRGRKALADLKEALLALPEKRLVSRALSTVGVVSFSNDFRRDYIDELLAEQGVGVCAVGAYIWHQRVKAGESPDEAMRALPMLDDDACTLHDTAE